MKDEKPMPDGISRRSFFKKETSLVAAVGLFPGSLLSEGFAGNSADGKSNLYACLFPLTKGPLKDNGATPWYSTLFIGTLGQAMTVMMYCGCAAGRP